METPILGFFGIYMDLSSGKFTSIWFINGYMGIYDNPSIDGNLILITFNNQSSILIGYWIIVISNI